MGWLRLRFRDVRREPYQPCSWGARQILWADRQYGGIETGLHLLLDVIAGEDRNRVCNRTAALNLAVTRRAVVSVAVRWIRHCRKRRPATLSRFCDFVSAHSSKKGFALGIVVKLAWLLP